MKPRELRLRQREHEHRTVVFDVALRRYVVTDAGPHAVDAQRPGVHHEPAAELGGKRMRRLELLEGDLVLPERDEPDAPGRRPRRGRAELGSNAGVGLQQSRDRRRTRVSDEAKRLRQANVGDVDGDDGHRHSSVSVTSATNAPDATVTLTVEGAGSVPERRLSDGASHYSAQSSPAVQARRRILRTRRPWLALLASPRR